MHRKANCDWQLFITHLSLSLGKKSCKWTNKNNELINYESEQGNSGYRFSLVLCRFCYMSKSWQLCEMGKVFEENVWLINSIKGFWIDPTTSTQVIGFQSHFHAINALIKMRFNKLQQFIRRAGNFFRPFADKKSMIYECEICERARVKNAFEFTLL